MGLRGFDNVFESLLMNELQDNLVQLYDWHLLCKGNYFNLKCMGVRLNLQTLKCHFHWLSVMRFGVQSRAFAVRFCSVIC